MRNLAKIVMFSSALIGAQLVSAPAMAQKTAPDGTYRGLVNVHKGISLTCTLELKVNAPTAGKATVSYFGPPNSLACSTVTFDSQPYDYTFDPLSGDLTLSGVHVNTITIGDCAGSITATWVDDTILVDSALPAATAGNPCTIEGALDFVSNP
jgi:hypothetical protein